MPGEQNGDVLALADSSIELVPKRHEQGVAFVADVWGRLTGHRGSADWKPSSKSG